MEDGGGLLGGVFFLVFFAVFVVAWAFYGYCLKLLADRCGKTENSWWAWVPLLNIILMLQMADKPIWWIVLFIIPYIGAITGLIASILIMIEVCNKIKKPVWMGVLAVIPPFGIVMLPYLAFTE